MKIYIISLVALGLSFSAQANSITSPTAADLVARCASFSGPLVTNGYWIGSVSSSETKISTDVREVKYTFQAMQENGITGTENAPVVLEITQTIDSSNTDADSPASVTYSCNLVYKN